MDEVPESLDPPALAARLGISLRTLRSWIKAGAVPSPIGGARPHFARAAILCAHAVLALRRDGIGLPEIARFLHKKTEAELREIGGLPPETRRGMRALPAPQKVRGALPADATATAPSPMASGRVEPLTVLDPGAEHEGSAAMAGSEWRRIELLPGLELHVRKDASGFVQGLAAAIAAGRFAK